MSSREKPSAVWVRSLVPKEKKSAIARDPVGDEAGARQLDHRPDLESAAVLPSSAATRSTSSRISSSSLS